MEDISWFIGGGEPGAAEYGAERGVDSRVGAVKVAAGEGAACDTITILVDLYGTSMPTNMVGRLHERPYCWTGKAEVVEEDLGEDFVGEEVGAAGEGGERLR